MTDERIYLSPPALTPLDKEAVNQALDSGWIAPLGPEVDLFERKIMDYCQVDHAVALSSGTAALHLALLSIGIQVGDKVIVPTLTFAATAFAVKYVGAEPIFIDSELSTWTIDTQLLEQYLDNTDVCPKAIICVDIFGRPCNFDELMRISSKFSIPLISDSAESLGAKYKGKPVGSQALITAFSFNGNKIISTSGGGMLVTNDSEIAAKVRYLATQARDNVHWYEHKEIGFNYRMSNLLAALGHSQLSRLNKIIEERRLIQEWYRENFRGESRLEIIDSPDWGTSNSWLTNLYIKHPYAEEIRNKIQQSLSFRNVESRFTWKPMHLQPIFRDSKSFLNGNSELLYLSSLCLPTGSLLNRNQVNFVSDLILSTLDTY